LGAWQDPPVYAIVARDQHAIHFRCAEHPTGNPNKYSDQLLDAYTFIEDVDTPYAEYAVRGVEFKRGLANMPWHSREFVVKDFDGRLLAFGTNLESVPVIPLQIPTRTVHDQHVRSGCGRMTGNPEVEARFVTSVRIRPDAEVFTYTASYLLRFRKWNPVQCRHPPLTVANCCDRLRHLI
jgi:hypothetical protein